MKIGPKVDLTPCRSTNVPVIYLDDLGERRLLCRGGVFNSSPEGLGYRSKVYPLHQTFIARHWRRILHDLEHLAKKGLRTIILGVDLTIFETEKLYMPNASSYTSFDLNQGPWILILANPLTIVLDVLVLSSHSAWIRATEVCIVDLVSRYMVQFKGSRACYICVKQLKGNTIRHYFLPANRGKQRLDRDL